MNAGSLLLLLLAILSEGVGTVALKASDGFARLGPTALVVVGYGLTFHFLGLALKQMPLGVAYAIWSGLGTAGAVLAGMLLWREPLNLVGFDGVALIVVGVLSSPSSQAPPPTETGKVRRDGSGRPSLDARVRPGKGTTRAINSPRTFAV
jgi:multidrug transporter EmrE-like cation transporter